MIVIDAPGLERTIDTLQADAKASRQILRALAASLKRITATEVSRAARAVYTIKDARLKKGLRIEAQTAGDSFGVRAVASSRPIGLQNYALRQLSRGLSAQVQKSGSRRVIARAFKAPAAAGSGTLIAFQRTGAAKRVPRKGTYATRQITRGPRKGAMLTREPVRVMFGPSVADMVNNKTVRADIVARWRERADREAARIARAFGVGVG